MLHLPVWMMDDPSGYPSDWRSVWLSPSLPADCPGLLTLTVLVEPLLPTVITSKRLLFIVVCRRRTSSTRKEREINSRRSEYVVSERYTFFGTIASQPGLN